MVVGEIVELIIGVEIGVRMERDKLGRFLPGQVPLTTFKKGNEGYWKGKKRSEEDKIKMGLGKKGNHYKKMSECKIGRKLSEETKKKMSISAIKYMKKMGRSSLQPNIGKFEKLFLDNLEKCIGFKILRQYNMGSFFVDGFCSTLNLVIEVNEIYHHQYKKSYDKRRKAEIKRNFNCNFINFDVPLEVIS